MMGFYLACLSRTLALGHDTYILLHTIIFFSFSNPSSKANDGPEKAFSFDKSLTYWVLFFVWNATEKKIVQWCFMFGFTCIVVNKKMKTTFCNLSSVMMHYNLQHWNDVWKQFALILAIDPGKFFEVKKDSLKGIKTWVKRCETWNVRRNAPCALSCYNLPNLK